MYCVSYCAVAGASSSLRRSSTAGSKALVAAAKGSSREAELLATVNNLKAALERAMACSIPNTRHMQVGKHMCFAIQLRPCVEHAVHITC